MENDFLDKTLEELDGENWGEPFHSSSLIINTFKLRKKRLCDFTIEDLRLMIGQQFSLEYLIPLALEKLSLNLASEGDLYEGDLLHSVLRVDIVYWKTNKNQYWKLRYYLDSGDTSAIHDDDLLTEIKSFRNIDNTLSASST